MEITVQEFKKQFPRFTPVYLPIYKQGKTYFKGDVVYYNQFTTNNADILSYSGSVLSFNTPLVCKTGFSGDVVTKEELSSIDVSNMADGIYNVYIPANGNQPYIMNNTVIASDTRPIDVDTDTIPIMTSNTTPSGIVSAPNGGFYNDNLLYTPFNQGHLVQNPNKDTNAIYFNATVLDTKLIYTYAENEQPQAGQYIVKLTKQGTNHDTYVQYIKIYTIDDNYINISLITGSYPGSLSYEGEITVNKPIKKIELDFIPDLHHNHGYLGAFQLIEKAVTTENTLWVDTAYNDIKTMILDTQGEWQPFNDIICGSITITSGLITSIVQPQYNNVTQGNIEDFGLFYQCKVDYTNDLPTVATSWQVINQSILNYCQDSDIINAIAEANINFNEQLFSKEDAKLIFMYLVAYYLTVDFKNALNQSSAGIVTSKSVGSVSESASIPQWILNDKILGAYARNGYGLKYLSLIQPYLVGNVMFFRGATTI